jgi:hypothetical protein
VTSNLELHEVDAVLRRVASLGVDWRSTRFATYRDEFMGHQRRDPAFIASFRAEESRQRLTFEAASQLLQLLLAETVWHLLDQRLLKGALEHVMAGPALDPSDDDRPRNTLLELVAAAHLADRFDVSLTANDEDVRLDHSRLGHGAVECKRPKALDNILPNLNKIGSQLRAREKRGSSFGVAVIGGDRIAQLASAAYEAPTIQVADSSMEEIAKIIADRVLRDSWDVACDLVPTACYATVVVTGSILVRQPLHVRPVCQIIDLHLARSRVSADIHEAFAPRSDGPMAKFVVDARTERSGRATVGADRRALPALETDLVLDTPPRSKR